MYACLSFFLTTTTTTALSPSYITHIYHLTYIAYPLKLHGSEEFHLPALVDRHELGHEGLQVEDVLGADLS